MLELINIGEADFGCEERVENAPLMCGLTFKGEHGYVYKEILDEKVDELALVKGMKISEEELENLLKG